MKEKYAAIHVSLQVFSMLSEKNKSFEVEIQKAKFLYQVKTTLLTFVFFYQIQFCTPGNNKSFLIEAHSLLECRKVEKNNI